LPGTGKCGYQERVIMGFGEDLARGLFAGFGTKMDIYVMAAVWFIGIPIFGYFEYLQQGWNFEFAMLAVGYLIACIPCSFIIMICTGLGRVP
jgi:hypothetical protein